MSMIEVHVAAVSSMSASYHEFLSRYSKSARVVYGFVEGKEDPCFYRGFIELLLPEDWHVELWPAGSKDKVYEIHRTLDWRRFKKNQVCFFVDRDISEMIPERLSEDRNIYVTSGYSIENDVVSKMTCHRILSEVCGFSHTDHAELEAVCELFERELEAFLTAMLPIMAWILEWRRRGGARPNLSDIQMRDLFSFANGRLKSNATPKGKSIPIYLHEQCNVAYTPGIDVTPIQAEFARGSKYKKFTRGKYVFWFLIEFCNTVHRDATALFSGMTKPPKMHVTLSSANGMTIVGTRTRIPRSLRSFIQGTYSEYIDRIMGSASQ